MRYFEFSASERMELSNDELADAIRREAIHRGVAPPISLPEQLRSGEIRGYETPAESIFLYEIVSPGDYGSRINTGIAYKTHEAAVDSMRGAIAIARPYKGGPVIVNGEWSVSAVPIGSPSVTACVVVKEHEFSEKAFESVRDECLEDLRSIRQAQYDAEVNRVKREEYLRLANNDESVARAFWAKTETTAWEVAS